MAQQQQFSHIWTPVVQHLTGYNTSVIALPGNLLGTPITAVPSLEATGVYLRDQLQGHPVFVSSASLDGSNGPPAVVMSVSGQELSQLQLKQEQQHQQTLDLYLVNEGKGKEVEVRACSVYCVCRCVCERVQVCVCCVCRCVCVCVCVSVCVHAGECNFT